MTELTMRERCARAVADKVPSGSGMRREQVYEWVDAVLDTLMVPTEGMVDMGAVEISVDGTEKYVTDVERQEFVAAWQSVIQHVLEDK